MRSCTCKCENYEISTTTSPSSQCAIYPKFNSFYNLATISGIASYISDMIHFPLMMSRMILITGHLGVCKIFISTVLLFYLPLPWNCSFNLFFEWRFKFNISPYILGILYISWSNVNILHTYSMYINTTLCRNKLCNRESPKCQSVHCLVKSSDVNP